MNLWHEQSWWKRTALVAGGGLLAVVAGCGIGYAATDVPPPNKIAVEQALRLLYADGSEMARFGKNRVLVRLNQVSPAAQHAVLAAEDRDFYSEPGISIKGIGRALFKNVKGGGVSQGGSTITQQYAKNAFLTQERTFSRKIKEVFIAVKMSRTVSKDQILEDYLNTIYFGRGAFGIEAAAQTYFGRHASQLSVPQAAVLASSIRSPAGYDPARHRDRAEGRWGYVLDGMVKKGWLTQEQRAALKFPAVRKRGEGGPSVSGDLERIRDQVETELQAHGFPEDRIAAGGLAVRTTIDKKAQTAAREVVEDLVPPGKKPTDPVSALVSIQPGTGRVVAYYGGSSPGGFDYANGDKGVQPGSSMKPYVLATALTEGKHLADQYDGHSPQEVCGDTVHNDEGDPPLGRVDLAKGLALSVNTVYTRLACDVGPKRVVAMAHKAGIRTPLDGEGGLSQQVALGSGGYEVRPLDHADGYATFAGKGMHATPFFVLEVKERNGNVVYKAKPKGTRAFSEEVAADATFAMQKVVSDGTGSGAKIPGRPTAGKTGTTTRNTNAWFCGFTPQLATAVWVGRPDGHPLKGKIGDRNFSRGVYGGTIPAEIFRRYMQAALEGQPVMEFPKSKGLSGPSTSAPTTTAPPTTATPTPTQAPTSAPTTDVTLPPVQPTKSPKPGKSPDPTPSATQPPPTNNPNPTPAASAAP
ncbi:MAG TPA: transglycosylase domain-containing protein [Mycobacteriales bacterium]|nr:transglycosylase domain-containing protein [Mycobacteriales bacterium]